MKISIVGTGYVGLVTGACLAEVGNHVLCFDTNTNKIMKLRDGVIPIYEPGLESLVKTNLKKGKLLFSDDVGESVHHGRMQFIAVGTPPGEDGSADLRHVLDAVKSIASLMNEKKIFVNKSTVPVGTADLVRKEVTKVLGERGLTIDFDVISNPEFLKEGSAVNDFMKPDRIIVGAESVESIQLMKELYSPFQKNHDRMVTMGVRSAELSKYAANAMLATRISFMNELACLSERVGADIESVRIGMGSDPRIGYDFLYPGVGYGGSCFPKDIKALIRMGEENNCPLGVLKATTAANFNQKKYFSDKVIDHYGKDLKGIKIGVWGLTFKPNTDDLREAPSIDVIRNLRAAGAVLRLYDPVAKSDAKELFPESSDIQHVESALDAVQEADGLILLTEWSEFRAVDWKEVRKRMSSPTVFDGRNVLSKQAILSEGFKYYGIGR